MPGFFATLIAALLGVALFMLFQPVGGWLSRWGRSRSATHRVLLEDALKHLHTFAMNGRRPTIQSLAGALEISENGAAHLLIELQARGLAALSDGTIALTPTGLDYALHIVRAHRLWERHLADETGYAASTWHGRADVAEHDLAREEVDALAMRLGNPAVDPHGDPIPTQAGRIGETAGSPMTSCVAGRSYRIVHLEDEPGVIFAQLMAEGLYPGMQVHVLETSGTRVRFWADGSEHVLAPMMAANVAVVALPAAEVEFAEVLSALKLGESARVSGISAACRGAARRRLLDLGILPGATISAELVSPTGDPTAYRIRDALIALRREQAQQIGIRREAQLDDEAQR